LGMIIGEKGVKMDLTKVEAIMSWPMPKHVKDIQAFLGLTNFYCQFIQDFSKLLHLYIILCTKRLYGDGGEANRRCLMN